MGASPRTVGGGANRTTSNQWNDFLQQQLSPQGNQTFDYAETMRRGGPAEIARQMAAGGNGGGQFGQLFNQMAGGQIQDPSGGFAALQNLINNPQTAQQFQNQYQNQEFVGANLSQLPTNFGAGQTGMADLSGINRVGPFTAGMGTQANLGSSAEMQQAMSQLLSGGGGVDFSGNIGLGAARNFDLNSPEVQAYRDIAARTTDRNAADLRERFGAEGIGALGTGAQFAESNLRAEEAPLVMQQIGNLQRMFMQQDLAERSTAAQVGLGNQGQNLQAALARAGNQLQGSGAALSGALTGRGQDLQNQLGNRAYDTQQGIANLNAGVQQRGQDLNSLLQNQQLGNLFGINAAQINNAAMQSNNNNAMNMAGMQNNFNLQNAGQNAQFGQANNQLNFNAGQAAFNNNLNAIMQGLGQNNFASQQQQNLLNQLFGAFGQSNAIGSPQAQVAMQPSPLGQAAGMGLQLGGMFLGGPAGGMFGSQLGGMFGGGSGNALTQAFAPPQSVFQGANFNPFQQGGFSFNGSGGSSPFGIGNPGGFNMNALDPRAIAADPAGFQQWMAANPNLSVMQ